MGFRQDEREDWVAELDCGHAQHVRHDPPWQERPWVTTAAGREGKLGAPLDCPACEGGRRPTGIWRTPPLVAWSRLLLDSFRGWTGRDLLPREGTEEQQAEALFFAPFVVVSHGVEADPILNYGNRAALELWETDWARFVRTPSRLTAEPPGRAERAAMLARVERDGYIDDYRGVRISQGGRRFLVERALVWTVRDATEAPVGQAATFSSWTFLGPA